MTIALSSSAYSHSHLEQLKSIISQYNTEVGGSIAPLTLKNSSYGSLYLIDLVYKAIDADLQTKGYTALTPLTPPDMSRGEGRAIKTVIASVVSSINDGIAGGLTLIPTGAVETVDGDYQHFATDGVHTEEIAPGLSLPGYFADLPTIDRQTDYVIDLEMPQAVLANGVGVFVVIAEDAGAGDLIGATKNLLRLSIDSYNNVTQIEIADINTPANDATAMLSPLPTADSVITLTLTATNLSYSWDGGSGNIAVPVGFFASAPNVLVASIAQDHADIIETSIKVTGS